jgi:hypothetical protein
MARALPPPHGARHRGLCRIPLPLPLHSPTPGHLIVGAELASWARPKVRSVLSSSSLFRPSPMCWLLFAFCFPAELPRTQIYLL